MGQAKQRKLAGTYPAQTPRPPRKEKPPRDFTPAEQHAMLAALIAKGRRKS